MTMTQGVRVAGRIIRFLSLLGNLLGAMIAVAEFFA